MPFECERRCSDHRWRDLGRDLFVFHTSKLNHCNTTAEVSFSPHTYWTLAARPTSQTAHSLNRKKSPKQKSGTTLSSCVVDWQRWRAASKHKVMKIIFTTSFFHLFFISSPPQLSVKDFKSSVNNFGPSPQLWKTGRSHLTGGSPHKELWLALCSLFLHLYLTAFH